MHDHSLYFHLQDNKMVPLNVTFDKVKSKNLNEADSLHRMAMLETCLKHKNQKGDSILGPTLASSGRNPSSDKMAVEGSLQTRCRPIPHPDSANQTKSQQKKASIGCSTGQLPQSLLNELSTVLNQTGRTLREESWPLTSKKTRLE